MSRRHIPRALRPLLSIGAAFAILTACGVPLDSTPRAVVASTTTGVDPEELTTSDESGSSAFLFFLANNQIINLDREVTSIQPNDVLTALFAGVPAGTSEDVLSQIPTGTRLLGVRQNGTQLDVDVSKDFDNLVGTGRSQATAQIVLTATDLDGIDQVSLLIEGQPTQVFSPISGDTDAVGACDYIELFPTEEVIDTWQLDRKSHRHLTTRRNMLATQCLTPPSSDG